MSIKTALANYLGIFKQIQAGDCIVPQTTLVPDISYTIYSNNCLVLCGTLTLNAGIIITQQASSVLKIL